jgi:hypothetical protein
MDGRVRRTATREAQVQVLHTEELVPPADDRRVETRHVRRATLHAVAAEHHHVVVLSLWPEVEYLVLSLAKTKDREVRSRFSSNCQKDRFISFQLDWKTAQLTIDCQLGNG